MGNSELYKILFNISKQDLAVSKLLYENEHYPQAVFSLQQSVEKAVKSLAVFTDVVQNPSKEIGHKCANFYKKTTDDYKAKIDRLENDKETTEFLSQVMGFSDDNLVESIQEIKEDVQYTDEVLDSAINKSSKYRLMSDADILHIISKLDELEEERNSSISNEASFFSNDEEFESYKMDMVNKIKNASDFLITKYREEGSYLVENAHEVIEAEMKSLADLDKDSWNKMFYLIIQMQYVSISLCHFSLITDAHAVDSRYPKNDFNPIEFYTPELPMIKNFEALINYCEKVVDSIADVYNEYAKSLALRNGKNSISLQ